MFNKLRKILFFIPTLGHGGAEKVLVNLVNNLDKSKYEVTLLTLFDVGENKKYLSDSVVYKFCFRKPFKGNSTLLSFVPAKWLYKLLIKNKYDIVVSYLEGPTSRIISACPYPETKKVMWIHIELNDKKKFKVGFRSFEEAKAAYEKTDKLIFVAETVKSAFEKTAGKKFFNGQVLYNTNETELIKMRSKEKIEDLYLDSQDIKVCSVAKIINAKGFDRLVRVHKRLILEGVKCHIYILGLGDQMQELKSYLSENRLIDSFSFLGYRDNPYKYIAACDLYVCSSRREGFSTAVTEALIVGIPVVSTDCSGAKELLGENNEYGIVTENSEEGIYQGLKKMLVDLKMRKEYAQKALERGKKFSREETVKAVEKMFDKLIQQIEIEE